MSPILLDDAPALLAPLERCPVNRAAGDGRRLPPRRFPSVLALAFWGPARSTEDHPAIRDPILRLAAESADWGAPKIHEELQKLGFVVSERSVARYLRRIRRRGDCAKRWLTFLQNHREVIAALDFFTVTTVTFRLLYCFFGIEHGRRRILHCNVTRHLTAEWVVQQLRQAFPEAGPYRYAIFVRDSIFNAEVVTFLKATGLKPTRTSVRAHWQKWSCGKMDWKLPARDPRPRHCAQRTTSSPTATRLRRLPQARFILPTWLCR